MARRRMPAVTLSCRLARWRHAPPIVRHKALAVACLTWLVVALVRRHGDRVPDRTAAIIDDEVRFGGELRSAAWFASNGSADQWSAFHLDRAATRLESADFTCTIIRRSGLVAMPRDGSPGGRGARDRLRISRQAASGLGRGQGDPRRRRRLARFRRSTSRACPRICRRSSRISWRQLRAACRSALATNAALLDALNKLQSIKDPSAGALARDGQCRQARRSAVDEGSGRPRETDAR